MNLIKVTNEKMTTTKIVISYKLKLRNAFSTLKISLQNVKWREFIPLQMLLQLAFLKNTKLVKIL